MPTPPQELLERVGKKLDADLSDALFEQANRLRELHEEKILALTPKTLDLEQKMIKAKREVDRKVSKTMIGDLESIL